MNVIKWDGQPISAPGVYSGVDMATYHGANLCVGPSISSSGLRTIFSDCPMAYWVYSPYNPKRLEPDESRAFILGRALHHLALGEADFRQHFIIRPHEYPDNRMVMKRWTRAADYCRAWEQEKRAKGLSILTPEELDTIRGMAGILPWQEGLEDSGLMNNAVVRAGALRGLIEHTVICQDKETGLWLKARPDVIPTDSTEASDLKSTQAVDERSLQRTLDEYRYDFQGACVSRCLLDGADFRLTNYALIFVCKGEPFEVAVRELKPFDLDDSAKDMQTAIRTFALCMERGKWPGVGAGESDARYLERSDWSRERARYRREELDRSIFT